MYYGHPYAGENPSNLLPEHLSNITVWSEWAVYFHGDWGFRNEASNKARVVCVSKSTETIEPVREPRCSILSPAAGLAAPEGYRCTTAKGFSFERISGGRWKDRESGVAWGGVMEHVPNYKYNEAAAVCSENQAMLPSLEDVQTGEAHGIRELFGARSDYDPSFPRVMWISSSDPDRTKAYHQHTGKIVNSWMLRPETRCVTR